MKFKAILIFLLLIFLIVVVACSSNSGPGKYDDFANCLTENNVKMYGTEWCPHCKNQKAEFGKSFGFVDYTDCDKNADACNDAGVRGYPTWVINGKSYAGEQPLEKLSTLSGCELKK